MVDVYVLADATALVVDFASNVPRVVFALAAGLYGCVKPFVSTSYNWCCENDAPPPHS